jgi:hypothetical protein
LNKSLFTPTNVLLFLLTLASVLWLLPAYAPDGNDREIFRFIGRSINSQFAPYRDVFDHKPPFIYFIFLDFQIFGDYDVFVSGLFCLLICLFLFVKITAKTNQIWRFLILSFLIVWLRNPAFYEYGGLTREFSAYLYCIFFYCFISKQRTEWLAFISGIVFINQQNDILPLLPLITYRFIHQKEYHLLRVVKIKMSFLLPLILIALWLIWQGAFSQFIQNAFVFNFNYYAIPFKNLIPNTLALAKKVPLILVSLLILIYYLKRSVNLQYFLALFFTIGFTLYNIMISGRFYGHYFLPLGPVIAFCFYEILNNRTFTIKKNLLIFISLGLCFISIFELNREFSLTKQKAIVAQNSFIKMQIDSLISQHSKNFERLSFINYSPGLQFHNKYNIKPASKYVYFSIWDEIPKWDSQLIEFEGYLNSISAHSTLVFDFSVSHPFVRNEMNQKLNNTLSTNSELIGQIKDNTQKIIANIYITKGL